MNMLTSKYKFINNLSVTDKIKTFLDVWMSNVKNYTFF